MKKFLSGFVLLSFIVSPMAYAEETTLAPNVTELKMQRLSEELQRNKELLEIWKEHVRSLTQERDEAIKAMEVMKSQSPASMPSPGSGQAAHFGQIETQPIPPGMMGAQVSAASSAAMAANQAQLEKDIAGYQQTIRDLRDRMTALQAQNDKTQKDLMESGNDRNLIIKDKAASNRPGKSDGRKYSCSALTGLTTR